MLFLGWKIFIFERQMLRSGITPISERCCSFICFSFNFTKRKNFRIRGFERCFRKEELNFDQIVGT